MFGGRLNFLRIWPIVLLWMLSSQVFAQAANIAFATGSATVVGADGVSRKAERGTVLQPGETVDTGDGKAQLRFRDGATISLQPGTQFRVKGTLRAVSGLIGKEKREQYRMDTTVGTIGIRGTEYGASLGDPGLAVTTYAGLVEVCNTAGCAMAGAGQTLQVPDANTRPRLLPGSNLPNLTPGAAMPQLPTPTHTNMPDAPQQQSPQTAPTYQPPTGGPSLRGPNY